MTKITIYHVQRAITPKAGKPVMVHVSCTHLMVVNISVKFHENTSNGFQVMGWTQYYDQNHYLQCSKGHNFKIRKNTAMVLDLHIVS